MHWFCWSSCSRFTPSGSKSRHRWLWCRKCVKLHDQAAGIGRFGRLRLTRGQRELPQLHGREHGHGRRREQEAQMAGGDGQSAVSIRAEHENSALGSTAPMAALIRRP